MYFRTVSTSGGRPCVIIPKDLEALVNIKAGNEVEIKPLDDEAGFTVRKKDQGGA